MQQREHKIEIGVNWSKWWDLKKYISVSIFVNAAYVLDMFVYNLRTKCKNEMHVLCVHGYVLLDR